MLTFFCKRLVSGRSQIANQFLKARVFTGNNYYLPLVNLSNKIMPPKRKAAASKAVEPEVETVEDYAQQPATKAKKGSRPKKEEMEPESSVTEKPKKGRGKKQDKEVEEPELPPNEGKEKKAAKKKLPPKGDKKEKEEEGAKEAPQKKKKEAKAQASASADEKRPVRGGAVKKYEEAPDEDEDDDFEKKVTKRKGKKGEGGEESNGVDKKKGGRKKKAEASSDEPKSKGRKKAPKEDKEDAPALANSTATPWESVKFQCEKKNSLGQGPNLVLSCWNVGGLKSWVKKDCQRFLDLEKPDIFCMQETKCTEEKLPEEIKQLEGYKQYWCASEKEGYAGVALLSKVEPLDVKYGIDVPELDEEGRCITAEYEKFYVICVYVPNSGRKLVTMPKRLEWNEAFKAFVKALDEKKPVIICGDMNVAHEEVDLARPASNRKNAGFTDEEREGFSDFLGDGYIDVFRELYPEQQDTYTFWTYMMNARSKNIGWRVDYFIVSDRIMENVCDNVIRTEVLGSDHCPLTLFINI